MRHLRRVWSVFARNRTATWLLIGLALVAALGSLIPQAPRDPRSLAAWLVAAGDAFGPAAHVLSSLQLTRYFASPWFWIPAAALIASLAICTATRWRRILRSATLYTHLAPLVLVVGALVSARTAWQTPVPTTVGGDVGPEGSVDLLAVHDPGYPIVIGALAVLVAGTMASLWRPTRWRRPRSSVARDDERALT